MGKWRFVDVFSPPSPSPSSRSPFLVRRNNFHIRRDSRPELGPAGGAPDAWFMPSYRSFFKKKKSKAQRGSFRGSLNSSPVSPFGRRVHWESLHFANSERCLFGTNWAWNNGTMDPSFPDEKSASTGDILRGAYWQVQRRGNYDEANVFHVWDSFIPSN